MNELILHWWTGGNLCMTAAGWRASAQYTSVRSKVTCERCLSNLKALDALANDTVLYGRGYLHCDPEAGRLTHIPLQELEVTVVDAAKAGDGPS